MTADELRVAEECYRDAAAFAERLRSLRNEKIRSALEDGWTHAAIAEATGLTRGRVGQLASPT